jgi:predicted DNA-binding transcriptional regulator AlpA
MENQIGFYRLPKVLEILPFSKSAWYAGVRSGKYPKPVRLSERTVCWRKNDITKLAEDLAANEGDK